MDVRVPLSSADLNSNAGAASSAPIDCIGDGSSGKRVQAIYAHASDVTDRYWDIAPLIQDHYASDVSAVFDASAADTGGRREVRWAQDSTTCKPVVWDLMVSSTGDDNFANTVDEIRNQMGYGRTDRRYMVWMDSNNICGQGEIEQDDQWNPAYNLNNTVSHIARIDVQCWGNLAQYQSGEAHELMHNIGGVQLSAPSSNAGWHCYDEYDTMCYDDDGPAGPHTVTEICIPDLHNRLFDCNHDDYYDATPAEGTYMWNHWDAADSSFLESVTTAPYNDDISHALPVELQGSPNPSTKVSVGHNLFATDAGDPNPAGVAGDHSVWWKYVNDSSICKSVSISTMGSGFDTVLGVYKGANKYEIFSNDDDPNLASYGGGWSGGTFDAAPGTYYIMVDSNKGSVEAQQGSILLYVNAVDASSWGGCKPSNDSSATSLSGSSPSVAGSNVQATYDSTDPDPYTPGRFGGHSVWYSWAPGGGNAHLDTRGSSFDTVMGVYKYGGGDRVLVALNDDDNSSVPSVTTSSVDWTSSAGVTYYVEVDGYDANVSDGRDGEIGSILINGSFTPMTYPLVVSKSGAGQGSVTSSPSGISCGSTCSSQQASFELGQQVTLTASPDAGSEFAGWSGGGCSGTGNCVVTMNSSTNVTATFNTVTAFGDSFKAPSRLTDPVVIPFSGDVRGVTPANVGLRLQGSSANMTAILACKNSSSAAVSCSTGPVRKVVLYPASALVMGQSYTAVVNPSGAPSPALFGSGTAVPSASRSFRASLMNDDSGPWAAYGWSLVKTTQAWGNSYLSTGRKGATATFKFYGSSVKWETLKGPKMGKAEILIDGNSYGTVDLYASSSGHREIGPFYPPGSGQHTIVVKVLGENNASSGGKAVAVDAFTVGTFRYVTPNAAYTSPEWTHKTSPSGAFGGSYGSTSLTGTTVTVQFVGTHFTWTALRGPNRGVESVGVDGASVTIDCSSAGPFDDYAVSSSYATHCVSGLSSTLHTIVIRVSGSKNASSGGYGLGIDKFRVA